MKHLVDLLRSGYTVEDLQRYFDSNPHPEYKVVSVNWMSSGSIVVIWEAIVPQDCQCTVSEALSQLVNFMELDPDLYKGDDDGTLGRIMYRAKKALKLS
jgi:hypothetical protein